MIGVLAALLLPALSEPRGRALRAVCAGNLRQAGQAMCMYATDLNGAIASVGTNNANYGWSHFTFVVKHYQPSARVMFHGLWVQYGYLSGRLLWCPGQTQVNPADAMAHGHTARRVTDRWERGRPTNLANINRCSQWLYCGYAFHTRLVAPTWGVTRPWTHTTTYGADIPPWQPADLDPNGPVLADLRTYINNGGQPHRNANHHGTGYNVPCTDGSVLWHPKPGARDFSDLGPAYGSPTHTASNTSTLWLEFLEARRR